MSAEHQHQPEHSERHEKQHDQLEQARREKMEQLAHHENKLDDSENRKAEARELIKRAEAEPAEPEPVAAAESKAPHAPILRLNPTLNYVQTMAAVQRRLAPVSRTFSHVIHTPVIEKTSEALEKTVARPSVVAGATWTALIIGAAFYFIARTYGYRLSGSEMLFAFVAGAFLGLALEAVLRPLRRR